MPRETIVAELRRKDVESQIGLDSRPNSFGSLSSNSEDERLQQADTQRSCLAKALKRNMVDIVGTMTFKESENADIVIPDCVNEEECEKIRGIADRRDQVRAFMTLVIRRSYAAMFKVVNIIQHQSPDLHSKIMGHFQEFCKEFCKETGNGKKWCSVCMIRTNVDIKDVCDNFYQESIMSYDLYSQMPYSTLKIGTQGLFWDSFFTETKETPPEKVMTIMISALSDKGPFHKHIVTLLKRDIDRRRQFKCRCQSTSRDVPSCRKSTASSETSASECSIRSQLPIKHAGTAYVKEKSTSRKNTNRLKYQQEIDENKSEKKSISPVDETKKDATELYNKDIMLLLDDGGNPSDQSCRSSLESSTLQSNTDRYSILGGISCIDSEQESLSRRSNRCGSLKRLFSWCCVCTTTKTQ